MGLLCNSLLQVASLAWAADAAILVSCKLLADGAEESFAPLAMLTWQGGDLVQGRAVLSGARMWGTGGPCNRCSQQQHACGCSPASLRHHRCSAAAAPTTHRCCSTVATSPCLLSFCMLCCRVLCQQHC